jgi:hypothetical protein
MPEPTKFSKNGPLRGRVGCWFTIVKCYLALFGRNPRLAILRILRIGTVARKKQPPQRCTGAPLRASGHPTAVLEGPQLLPSGALDAGAPQERPRAAVGKTLVILTAIRVTLLVAAARVLVLVRRSATLRQPKATAM